MAGKKGKNNRKALVLLLLCLALPICGIVGALCLRRTIFFHDSNILACATDGFGIKLILWMTASAMLCRIIWELFAYCTAKRTMSAGTAGTDSKKAEKKRKRLTKKAREKSENSILAVYAALFLTAVALNLFGCFGRTELTREGMTQYSVFGITREAYRYPELSYTLDSRFNVGSRTGSDYQIGVTIRSRDGETALLYADFRDAAAMRDICEAMGEPEAVDAGEAEAFLREELDMSDTERGIIRELYRLDKKE